MKKAPAVQFFECRVIPSKEGRAGQGRAGREGRRTIGAGGTGVRAAISVYVIGLIIILFVARIATRPFYSVFSVPHPKFLFESVAPVPLVFSPSPSLLFPSLPFPCFPPSLPCLLLLSVGLAVSLHSTLAAFYSLNGHCYENAHEE